MIQFYMSREREEEILQDKTKSSSGSKTSDSLEFTFAHQEFQKAFSLFEEEYDSSLNKTTV